jgi:NAD(P)-dependent dehydrogenase (short-subunit alcohol dehydrogenase family)
MTRITHLSAPIALVAGGTSGIGKATAKILAAKSATVILCGRRANEGAPVVEEIRAAGERGQFVRCDVRDEPAISTMIEAVVVEYGRLDWAANCAAVSLDCWPTQKATSFGP